MSSTKQAPCDQAVAVDDHLQKKIQGDFLKCAVCYNTYSNPKNLDCGHIVCLGCIEGIIEAKKKRSSVHCPICRKKTSLSRKGPSKLPDNFMVLGMISMLRNNSTAVDTSVDKNIAEHQESSNKQEDETNDSLVQKLVRIYERTKGENNTTTKKRYKSKERKEKEDSISDIDDSSDTSSEDDSDGSCSESDSSDEDSDGESLNSEDSYDSDLNSENNDLSELSFVNNDSELTLNSSDSYSESSSEGSSDECSSGDSETSESDTSSDSDSDSSSEDDEQSQVKSKVGKNSAAKSNANTKTAKNSKKAMAAKNKNTPDVGIKKETKPNPKKTIGEKTQPKAVLKDITKTSRINTKGSLKSAGQNLGGKKNEPKAASKNQALSSKPGKPLKSCNGMRVGSEILVFAGKSEPLAVKLHWLEKVVRKPGAEPQVFAGIQLKTKESFRVGISKEFRAIKNYKGENKSWLKDEKKFLRAVVPIHQCIPKNLLQAITTMKQFE